MRILLVATTFPRPSQTFVVGKLEGLLDAGWDAHIACRKREPLELAPLARSTAGDGWARSLDERSSALI